MSDTTTPATERRSHPPLWLVEGLDLVQQRRSVLIAVTVGVIVVGGVLAVLAPGLVPPVPIVGAAVGLAALLLGLAVAVALDAADLRLRGPRHVGAAGGELVAVLPTRAERAGAATLAGAVLEARVPGSPLLLGLAASGRDIRPTVAWTDALAIALEAEGVSVLRIDLASGHTRSPGLLEVVRDGVKLASAVTFGPEKRLARLGAGEDLSAALGALSSLPGRLPRDLDVLLVALPMAATRPVVTAVRSLDHVLIIAQRDRTSRVELIAGLDALEAVGTRAQVALLDDRTAARLAPRSVAPAPETAPEVPGIDPEVEDDAPAEAVVPPPAADAGTLPEKMPAAAEGKPAAEETDDRSPEELEAALEHRPEAESGATSGPRSGGALGVGGAALTAAGIAAAFEAREVGSDVEPEVEPDEPDAVPPAEPDAVAVEPPDGATPDLRADDDGGAQAVLADHEADSDPAAGQLPDGPPAPQHSERREVEVVHGAAEAAAIALVQLPVEPPFDVDELAAVAEGPLPVGGEVAMSEKGAPQLPPAPVSLDGMEPETEPTPPEDARDAAPEALDRTDEIPAVGPSGAISDADSEHEEMMRTTAQLSVLLEDVHADGNERPLDTP